MKAALVFLLAGSSLLVHAQSTNLRAACGSGDLPFTVKLANEAPASPDPEPGKALVFFIQDAGASSSIAYPTTRIGMDGAWVGANKDSSYTALTVESGEHHACVEVQSSFVDNSTELLHFTAEAGKTYYFRTRLLLAKSLEYLEVTPIDSDQGWYLVNTFPRSTIKPKK
ncbi:MAG TPA: DUF2846 domain-containing protein [Acidobacteriaceae bacterium]|nr:DUF2846 domain-containing protein [Acidobacteriaceae bacterium]